ncbi:NFX1-type zinc finger-containing protein 1-like [Orbicella faveolata]|uniref:NFX1-type zinc finger-containing protein 1-like n=1 Tax=Orbicella faveolata TaxID=48498 RepID=UPI0009E3894D|nr:NFX1-type zinc finger-containing protein 1-like [Orbicella faveolata]
MELVTKILPLCGHVQNVPCSKNPVEVNCQSPCSKILSCGHRCKNRCSEECSVKCTAITKKYWPCGHENETECHVNPLHSPCRAPCGVTLKCEHPCAGDCFRCLRGRVHLPCKAECGRTLFCGHSCSEPCTKNCPPCKDKCGNYCKHSKCTKKCGEPCDLCNEKCIWRCEHHKCTKLCGELCNRPRCDEPCTKQLTCGHPCIGLCGEICPKKCRECHKDEVTEIFFGTEDEPDARFVELADCGHVFEVMLNIRICTDFEDESKVEKDLVTR